MLSTERPDFERHAAVLCAGFNVPATAERMEAYWRGLVKMPLSSFARCVEHALGERGPEKIPTVPQFWALNREMRTRIHQPTATDEGPDLPLPIRDGNKLLLEYLRDKGGCSDASLPKLLEARTRVMSQFLELHNGGEKITIEEVREKVFAAFNRVFELA